MHPGRVTQRVTRSVVVYRSLVWQAGAVKVVFDAELWLWDARRTETWTFVSLPASQSEEIRDLAGGLRRGFGSVRGSRGRPRQPG